MLRFLFNDSWRSKIQRIQDHQWTCRQVRHSSVLTYVHTFTLLWLSLFLFPSYLHLYWNPFNSFLELHLSFSHLFLHPLLIVWSPPYSHKTRLNLSDFVYFCNFRSVAFFDTFCVDVSKIGGAAKLLKCKSIEFISLHLFLFLLLFSFFSLILSSALYLLLFLFLLHQATFLHEKRYYHNVIPVDHWVTLCCSFYKRARSCEYGIYLLDSHVMDTMYTLPSPLLPTIPFPLMSSYFISFQFSRLFLLLLLLLLLLPPPFSSPPSPSTSTLPFPHPHPSFPSSQLPRHMKWTYA